MINLRLLRNCKSVINKDVAKFDLELPIITDTRRYTRPSVFVAIPGAKVNPLDLISRLLDEECPVVIYTHTKDNQAKVEHLSSKYPRTHFLPVTDSVTFLQEISHEHVKEWKSKSPLNTIFAISGSNGKTTHKEMLSFILRSVMPDAVVATEKNNNNHLGVPLTLLEISEKTKIVVLELGSNHPGEIKVLCDIALPNAGLTTNIGATHLEFFGDEEKVFLEEAYLYHAVKNVTHGEGFYLINKDDRFLKSLAPTKGSVDYGLDSGADAVISILDDGAKILYKGEELVGRNHYITGTHNKLNLITCLFVATRFFPQFRHELISAASEFRPTKNRSEWIQFEGKSVYLDAYNANPSSMKAALLGFRESVIQKGYELKDTCVVLGDMNELGDSAPKYHEEVGHYLQELGFPHVYFIGKYSQFYQKGLSSGNTRSSAMDFKTEFRADCLSRYPIHFIKGSRSLQLESLFDIT